MTSSPPYRRAVRAGDFLYISGQLPVRDGDVIDGDVAAHTTQALANLDAVLAEHGASARQVVKTTVLLADIGDWAAMNVPYLAFFDADALPSRSAFGVDLPRGALVEIEAVAYLG
ncbi:MAG: RidA family protein [Actinobacteria bacterium]|nr:RidA family protein [Actinomycetota bacterium]MCA1722265.1 RidA family protein [Actinomycetota bacterium]